MTITVVNTENNDLGETDAPAVTAGGRMCALLRTPFDNALVPRTVSASLKAAADGSDIDLSDAIRFVPKVPYQAEFESDIHRISLLAVTRMTEAVTEGDSAKAAIIGDIAVSFYKSVKTKSLRPDNVESYSYLLRSEDVPATCSHSAITWLIREWKKAARSTDAPREAELVTMLTRDREGLASWTLAAVTNPQSDRRTFALETICALPIDIKSTELALALIDLSRAISVKTSGLAATALDYISFDKSDHRWTSLVDDVMGRLRSEPRLLDETDFLVLKYTDTERLWTELRRDHQGEPFDRLLELARNSDARSVNFAMLVDTIRTYEGGDRSRVLWESRDFLTDCEVPVSHAACTAIEVQRTTSPDPVAVALFDLRAPALNQYWTELLGANVVDTGHELILAKQRRALSVEEFEALMFRAPITGIQFDGDPRRPHHASYEYLSSPMVEYLWRADASEMNSHCYDLLPAIARARHFRPITLGLPSGVCNYLEAYVDPRSEFFARTTELRSGYDGSRLPNMLGPELCNRLREFSHKSNNGRPGVLTPNRFPNLETYSERTDYVSDSVGFDTAAMRELIEACPKLKNLTVPRLSPECSSGLQLLARRAGDRLQSLCVERASWNELAQLGDVSLPNLTSFSVELIPGHDGLLARTMSSQSSKMARVFSGEWAPNVRSINLKISKPLSRAEIRAIATGGLLSRAEVITLSSGGGYAETNLQSLCALVESAAAAGAFANARFLDSRGVITGDKYLKSILRGTLKKGVTIALGGQLPSDRALEGLANDGAYSRGWRSVLTLANYHPVECRIVRGVEVADGIR